MVEIIFLRFNRGFQENTVAKMVTQRNATHYSMDHKYRGKVIIFNHEHFRVAGLKSRSGTQNDCNNIYLTMKGLGFDVTVCQDLDYQEINATVIEGKLKILFATKKMLEY